MTPDIFFPHKYHFQATLQETGLAGISEWVLINLRLLPKDEKVSVTSAGMLPVLRLQR